MDRYDLSGDAFMYISYMLLSDGGLKRYAIGAQMAALAQSCLKYNAEYEKLIVLKNIVFG